MVFKSLALIINENNLYKSCLRATPVTVTISSSYFSRSENSLGLLTSNEIVNNDLAMHFSLSTEWQKHGD